METYVPPEGQGKGKKQKKAKVCCHAEISDVRYEPQQQSFILLVDNNPIPPCYYCNFVCDRYVTCFQDPNAPKRATTAYFFFLGQWAHPTSVSGTMLAPQLASSHPHPRTLTTTHATAHCVRASTHTHTPTHTHTQRRKGRARRRRCQASQ